MCIVLMSSLVRAKLYTWYVPKMQSVAENNCSGLAILRCGVAVQFAFFWHTWSQVEIRCDATMSC